MELLVNGYRRRIERSVGPPLAVQHLDRHGQPPRQHQPLFQTPGRLFGKQLRKGEPWQRVDNGPCHNASPFNS
jgi:hypothetical protein